MMQFGVLGTARVAQKGMLPALRDSELAALVMIGSRDKEKAKAIALQFGAENSGSYDEVLKNKDVKAVYISLPNVLHEEWTLKALEAGKHVICEKPAVLSYVGAKKVVEAAKKHNVRLLEGLMYRHHPQNIKVKELIAGNALGAPLRFDGCFAFAMPKQESNAMNKELGGGTINDQFCYPVSASRMVFGEEPEEVYCTIENDPTSGVSTRAHATLFYPGGKLAFVSSLFGSYYRSTYSILGTEGYLQMGRAYAVPRDMATEVYIDKDDKTETLNFPAVNHFQNMAEDFVQEIAKGADSNKDFENDLLRQARVMEAAKMSAHKKRLVKLSEIQ